MLFRSGKNATYCLSDITKEEDIKNAISYTTDTFGNLDILFNNAGIFENDQFCLITEEAKENINEIHHRQPVILNQTDINRYLNLELQGSAFLKERKIPNLIFHEVSKDVNKPTNNSASLIQKV